MPFSPLGRGFLTATISTTDGFPDDDSRRRMPRFTPEALRGNQRIVDTVRAIAAERGCLAGQVALAWVQSRGSDVVPIHGTKRVEYLEQNVGALDVRLSTDELVRLDGLAAETVGGRY